MEQRGDQGVICRQFKCQCPSDWQRPRKHSGWIYSSNCRREDSGGDGHGGCLDMRWGHGRAKKTGTWSRDLILVYSGVSTRGR